MSNLIKGRDIVCVFYDHAEQCWLRGESYYRKEETQFMYADDWEKYEAQRLLLEESMSFVTLDDDTAKLLLEHENDHKKAQVKQYNDALGVPLSEGSDYVINKAIRGEL